MLDGGPGFPARCTMGKPGSGREECRSAAIIVLFHCLFSFVKQLVSVFCYIVILSYVIYFYSCCMLLFFCIFFCA